ncbi:hypothetical protein D6T91_02680 [Salmonella enterica subsp. houtenae]|nr:hypothetical protein [Salmonella enterica subsp. houtenae]
MDNTYICEQISVSTCHTNNFKKWRDNDHINHISPDLSGNLYDEKSREKNKKWPLFKQINHTLLLPFTPPAHRQRATPSEHRYRKKIMT